MTNFSTLYKIGDIVFGLVNGKIEQTGIIGIFINSKLKDPTKEKSEIIDDIRYQFDMPNEEIWLKEDKVYTDVVDLIEDLQKELFVVKVT